MKNLVEKIDWEKCKGLIPAIIQDESRGMILMLGYMNKKALKNTLKTKNVWFYSRSRKKLWMKGETSKNILKVMEIMLDCDNDTLLIKVNPAGPTCHQGDFSCFKEKDGSRGRELLKLFKTIANRKEKMPKKSYTAYLFKAGLDKISLKIAEESLEVVQAAQKQTKKRLIEETVDLIYHLFVLLVDKKVNLEQVEEEIRKRKK